MADTRIEQIEYLLSHHSSTLEAIIHRMDHLEARIGGVAASVVHLERQMAQEFADIKQNQRTMLDLMMSKFGEVDRRFVEVDSKLNQIIALIQNLHRGG